MAFKSLFLFQSFIAFFIFLVKFKVNGKGCVCVCVCVQPCVTASSTQSPRRSCWTWWTAAPRGCSNRRRGASTPPTRTPSSCPRRPPRRPTTPSRRPAGPPPALRHALGQTTGQIAHCKNLKKHQRHRVHPRPVACSRTDGSVSALDISLISATWAPASTRLWNPSDRRPRAPFALLCSV